MIKFELPSTPEVAHELRESARSLLVNQIGPAQERKRYGRLHDRQEALERLHILVSVLLELFRGFIPTFLDNEEALGKVEDLTTKVSSPYKLRTQSFEAYLWIWHLVSTVHAADRSIACPPVKLPSCTDSTLTKHC